MPDDQLDPELFHIAREKGTETPFLGKYWNEHSAGMYHCAVCGSALFSSDTKFDSDTGWPSFTDPVHQEHIKLHEDRSLGLRRIEVTCKTCGAHLGHLFEDGPRDKGGKRYCINSTCLRLAPK